MKYATVGLLGLVLALLAIRWLGIKTPSRVTIGDPVIDYRSAKEIFNSQFQINGGNAS